MATNKRTYPNDNFAWYNDDDRLAILCEDNESVSGERTTERYDTFQGTGDLSGTITNMTIDGTTVTVTCSEAHGLTASTDRITISGTRHYNASYTIASTPSTTTFTITSSAIASNADSVNAIAVSASGVATATTAANHGYLVGDKGYINADNNTYDEEGTITTTNGSTQFQYSTSKGEEASVGAATVGDTGSFVSLFIDNGLRITYHSKYDTVSAQTHDLKTNAGLDSGLHPMVVCFIKARMFEDAGDIERANYFRQMYEKGVHQYPLRKSGVRALSVPKL